MNSNLHKKVDRSDNAARREQLQSPEIVQRTKAVRYPTGVNIKIFEVQSIATGYSIYNCYKQTLDATEWNDTTGDPKFDDKNTTQVEVLNLAEFDPEAEYEAQLVEGDLIAAWQMADDEGNQRWVGVPFQKSTTSSETGVIHNTYCKTDAGEGSTIVCYLDTDGTGDEITVHCSISGGSDLNAAIRRLEDGDRIAVYKIGSTWYAAEGFQASTDCICTAP